MIFTRVTVAALLLACSVWGADVAGKWKLSVVTGNGTREPSVVLVQSGGQLTGTFIGDNGEAKLTGAVKGADVEFTFTLSHDGGDPFTVKFHGTLDEAGKLKGKVQAGTFGEFDWTGVKQPAQ